MTCARAYSPSISYIFNSLNTLSIADFKSASWSSPVVPERSNDKPLLLFDIVYGQYIYTYKDSGIAVETYIPSY
jgi:hypothetical protein